MQVNINENLRKRESLVIDWARLQLAGVWYQDFEGQMLRNIVIASAKLLHNPCPAGILGVHGGDCGCYCMGSVPQRRIETGSGLCHVCPLRHTSLPLMR